MRKPLDPSPPDTQATVRVAAEPGTREAVGQAGCPAVARVEACVDSPAEAGRERPAAAHGVFGGAAWLEDWEGFDVRRRLIEAFQLPGELPATLAAVCGDLDRQAVWVLARLLVDLTDDFKAHFGAAPPDIADGDMIRLLALGERQLVTLADRCIALFLAFSTHGSRPTTPQIAN